MKNVLSLLLITVVILFMNSCGQEDNKKKELELKERELALKEKELALKEKDSENSNSSTQKENKTLVQEANKSSANISTDKSTPTIEKNSSDGYNFDKHNDIKIFINDLAKAVSTNDRNTVSQMINFPFVDTWGDNPGNQSLPLGCKTVNQFLDKYDKIFTSDIMKAITSKKYRAWIAPDPKDEFDPGDVIEKGEYLINCFKDSYDKRPCNMFGIKKVNGKFKIYSIKFSS